MSHANRRRFDDECDAPAASCRRRARNSGVTAATEAPAHSNNAVATLRTRSGPLHAGDLGGGVRFQLPACSAHQIGRGRNQTFNRKLPCLLLLHRSRCPRTRTVGTQFFYSCRLTVPHSTHPLPTLTSFACSSPTPGDSTRSHGQKESQERRRRCSRRAAASAAAEAATGAASAAGGCLACAQ